jgi:hypothetical protein
VIFTITDDLQQKLRRTLARFKRPNEAAAALLPPQP